MPQEGLTHAPWTCHHPLPTSGRSQWEALRQVPAAHLWHRTPLTTPPLKPSAHWTPETPCPASNAPLLSPPAHTPLRGLCSRRRPQTRCGQGAHEDRSEDLRTALSADLPCGLWPCALHPRRHELHFLCRNVTAKTPETHQCPQQRLLLTPHAWHRAPRPSCSHSLRPNSSQGGGASASVPAPQAPAGGQSGLTWQRWSRIPARALSSGIGLTAKAQTPPSGEPSPGGGQPRQVLSQTQPSLVARNPGVRTDPPPTPRGAHRPDSQRLPASPVAAADALMRSLSSRSLRTASTTSRPSVPSRC